MSKPDEPLTTRELRDLIKYSDSTVYVAVRGDLLWCTARFDGDGDLVITPVPLAESS